MNMKKFYNEKGLAEYLNASIQYVNDEIYDFIYIILIFVDFLQHK